MNSAVKINIGEMLLLDCTFTTRLLHGYFIIHLQSPHWEEKSIHFRYDEVKKLGKLSRRYDNENIRLRCEIPKNWGPGEYDVTVQIIDVFSWMFSFKKIVTVASQRLKISISDSC